ncbi:flavin reductase (DIM6/NTAB) family NADH-FMN oxidoreductase RutF [Glutamicibacter mysorens]|uniref:Flavin reductase (DIM6/NTAB) family NADH-FMN oxidoreductase RutF n=1 Tax=Glutamicibacter mysorens TaxID=257984 RepID=A0ABX4N5R7_9MICC|nr:flavin reductase family protein [Glutamicibacter mysorens]PJJ45177.1 flavin reductase (DIM6/NTAB) family NADH-FMN oxidoreductase RutF [Glutamicibacter mysorens]
MTLTSNVASTLASDSQESKNYWRKVLGQYPTGVTLITSVDEHKNPVGMVVGTFTSVSQDPPLVGFMPMNTSRTLDFIIGTGRFRASVLGDEHEELVRRFMRTPHEKRFAGEEWEFDAHGIPQLGDAVAWFDASVSDVMPAGDHKIILGAVEGLGLGRRSGTMPLLFLGGQYGSFNTPIGVPGGTDLASRLKVANKVGDSVRELAAELDVECTLSTVIGESVLVLSEANSRMPYGGMSFPFAAPIAPAFAVWGTDACRNAWISAAKAFHGQWDDRALEDAIAQVQRNGYSLSFGPNRASYYERAIACSTSDAPMAQLWKQMESDFHKFRSDPHPEKYATLIQVPVFGPDGTAHYDLVVTGFGPDASPDRFAEVVSTALKAGQKVTELIGGATPANYQPVLP